MNAIAAPPGAEPKHKREYVVLEEQTVAALLDHVFPEEFPELPDHVIAELERVTIYTKVATLVARNTDHASQQAGPQAQAPAEPVLIPVAANMWKPRTQPVDRAPRAGKPVR